MLEQIQAALNEVGENYQDTRIHHYRLTVEEVNGRYSLSGTVLDEATLQAVRAELSTRFPDVAVNTTAVQVLRGVEPAYQTVTTNLTGFYAGPSWLAEMVSQLLNGARVEVLLKQERWAYVRQADGYLGWAYRAYMDSLPEQAVTHLIGEPVSLLRCDPHPGANLNSRAFAGTAVRLTAVIQEWAQVWLAGGMMGWVPADTVRSLDDLPKDESGRRAQMVKEGQRFIGVPYLWGGCTALGIDCSGFAQLVHKMVGITIPRDADMQYQAGRPVEPPFQPGDLLFFGQEGDHRAISHVGVSLGGWRLLHASRANNGVYVDNVQMVAGLRERFLGGRTFLVS